MKTILSIFTAILFLVALSIIVNAGSMALPAPEGDGPGTKTAPIQQPRKQLQTPPAKLQKPTRTDARPVLKSTEPFKPLPNDDRKKMNDDMDP